MRPRTGYWIKINTDGHGNHVLSAALDEELGTPPYIGWQVERKRIILWPASADSLGRCVITRPRNKRIRQFRSRKLAAQVEPGRYEAHFEGRWAVCERKPTS